MTREDIIREYLAGEIDLLHTYGGDEQNVVVDFALAMVRKHNEELAQKWERSHGFDKWDVAKTIREACPK